MADPYIGEVRMFGGTYAPVDWALCNGQLLQISQNAALYSLIGTTYGGDGQNTFALPNLQSRVPIHQGGSYSLGQAAGEETGVGAQQRDSVAVGVRDLESQELLSQRSLQAGTFEQHVVKPSADDEERQHGEDGGLAKSRDHVAR